MDFTKVFDAKQVETQINTVVDTMEKGTNSALIYVQPEQVRDTLTSLNKAGFEFARASMATVKTFGFAVEKAGKEFAKNFEKATKTA